MSAIYHKVVSDVLYNRTRTLLVVLSTAVGLLALGMSAGVGDILGSEIPGQWEATRPAHFILALDDTLDEDTIAALARTPGVAEIEPALAQTVHWRLPGETRWRAAGLAARHDYEQQRQDILLLESGNWQDVSRSIVWAERGTSAYFNLPPGSEIVIQVGQTERRMRVGGVVRDLASLHPQLGGAAQFYMPVQALQDLMGVQGYNRLLVRMPQFDRNQALTVGDQLKERAKRVGVMSGTPNIQDPRRHFSQQFLEPITVIMGVLGVLSLGLSAFLIVNTVNAVLAQQVSQIGVMKAVGATLARVMQIYLLIVLGYGLMAICVAVPLALLLARALSDTLLSILGMKLPPFQVMPRVLFLQVGVGLIVPVLAALWPVFTGARITVRQAIASYGLGADFGSSPLDRLIMRIRGLPRPLALSLRNAFRRRGRMALTLATLTLAGILFIAVMSTTSSFVETLNRVVNAVHFDVMVQFEDAQRWDWVERIARGVPGVVLAELDSTDTATLDLGGIRKRDIGVFSQRPDSPMYDPQVTAGRWLQSDDANEVVLNRKIAAEEGLKVGDQVKLKLETGDSTWEIVGLIKDLNNQQQTAFVPRGAFTRALRWYGKGHILKVETDRHDPATQAAVEQQLRAAFEANGIRVVDSVTREANRVRNMNQFGILSSLLMAMSVLAGAVGGLGLMGTLSINVMERSREIGVLRAIGASSGTLAGMFVAEGMIVGLLSALIAIPLSYPAAWLFTQALGRSLIEMDFQYSVEGLVVWLVIVLVLSGVASLWPALRAARMSVRETLAYE